MSKTQPPALSIQITRGATVESLHTVHAVVMDGAGKNTAVYGDAHRMIFPRSSLKPLQAIALLETGAAESFHVSNEEIALACASHSAEEIHTQKVMSWLKRLNLDETALECGAQPRPHVKEVTALHNNCSGKHVGMLTLSLFLKTDTKGYTNPHHPTQQKILSTMAEMCGCNLTPACCGIDGCSAPNPGMPLENMARGFAVFMNPAGLGIKRGTACRHIYTAMTENPALVGGTEKLDTVLMTAAKGKIMSKTGAEGVYIAVIPEKNAVVALKAEDGATRAAQTALYALLEKHDLAAPEVLAAIRPLCLPDITNWRGTVTGKTAYTFNG